MSKMTFHSFAYYPNLSEDCIKVHCQNYNVTIIRVVSSNDAMYKSLAWMRELADCIPQHEWIKGILKGHKLVLYLRSMNVRSTNAVCKART